MKKQSKKSSKEEKNTSKKTVNKEKETTRNPVPTKTKAESKTKQDELPQPTPESEQDAPQTKEEVTAQVAADVEKIQQRQQLLNDEDRRRLQFKFGARINDQDLIGTREEVAEKVYNKTGESQASLLAMMEAEEYLG